MAYESLAFSISILIQLYCADVPDCIEVNCLVRVEVSPLVEKDVGILAHDILFQCLAHARVVEVVPLLLHWVQAGGSIVAKVK